MKYTTLYTVEILHDYFTSGRAGEIIFTPTEACQRALKRIKAFTKTWQNKLYVIVPTNDGIKPALALPADAVFEFFWQPADAQFFSYTALAVNAGMRYYCHNAVASKRNGKKYLHPLPALHNGGKEYSLGSFVSNGSGACFEAMADLGAGNNLANGLQWANRGEVAYLSAEQQVQCYNGLPVFKVLPADTNVQVQVFGWNHLTNFPDKLVFTDSFSHPATVTEQQVDLRQFESGLYRVLVNGTAEQFCYLDPQDRWHSELGIISIYHNAAIPASNALVGAGGEILSPAFTIRLSPPSVIWQYKARTTAVKQVEDESGLIHFDAAAPAFTSKLPIRLQQLAYDKIMLEYNNTSPPDPLKTVLVKKLTVPTPGTFETIHKNSTDYLMATVLLNY